MSEIGFPPKDLARRKQQTILTIVGLTIAIAATIFLLLFGSNLGFEISLFISDAQSINGFQNIFFQFIRVVSIINLVTGPLITSFLVHLMASTRMRDIGIMKASGCLNNSVFEYFFTELSIIVIISTIAGTALGIVTYYGITIFLNVAGFSFSQNLDITAIIVVVVFSIFFSHVFGALPIRKAVKTKPTDALSPTYQQESNAKVGSKFPSKIGLTLKVVYRNLVRKQSGTIHAIICFTAVFTLITVIVTGGLVAKETTSSYVERAIGKNVIIIGDSTITERYVDLLSQSFNPQITKTPDYLGPQYEISEHFLAEIQKIEGITAVDARLIIETSVREVLGVIVDPVDQSNPILIGGNRTENALILGIHPEYVINNWLFYGQKVGVNDQNVAMVGDLLASSMFEDATNQRIRVFDSSHVPYDVVGVCVDPLNNGKVVYLPIETMHKDISNFGHNLAFVQIDSTENPQAANQLEKIATAEKLDIKRLDFALEKTKSFLGNIWSSVMFLPFFTLATASVALFSYLNLSISGQKHEFGVMKALGAKQKTVFKIIVCQAAAIILISGLIGIFAGLFIAFDFLLVDPVISESTIHSVLIWLTIIPWLLCISSFYTAQKTAKQKILDTLSSFY